MSDEQDIRELIGRMAGAQRQGFHLTPGMMRLVLTTMRFYLATRALLARPKSDPHDDPVRKRSEPYTGPLPTIGETRSHGVVACIIECDGPNCWHQRRFNFDELGLGDDTIFVHIPKLRRFRCERCGCRAVRVSADWTDHVARGNGKASTLPRGGQVRDDAG